MTGLYDALAVPFGWLLGQFYNFLGNYLVAIAVFALLVKLVLLPSAISQQKNSAKQTRLQPKIRRIQERYKGEKDAQRKIQEEQQALYQREGFNPMNAGCLPLLIQFPIIIGLYGAVYKPLTYCLRIGADNVKALTDSLTAYLKTVGESATAGRSFEIEIINRINDIWNMDHGVKTKVLEDIRTFGEKNFELFGVSLGDKPQLKLMLNGKFNLLILIPILSFLTSMASSLIGFIRSKRTNPNQANNMTMGCMTFGMPLFSLFLVTQFPAAVGIYWIINNVYSFIQTLVVGHVFSPEKTIAKTMVEETIQRRSKEANTKLIAAKKTQV